MSRLGYEICVVKRSDLGWSSSCERAMPRIVFLDLETSSLEADGGIIVGAGVMSEAGESEYFEARRAGQEKPLLSKLRTPLGYSEVIVTWSGRGADSPFLTTRLLQ